MATVAQDVQQIRTAVYGKDVREAIADGIENCYSDITRGKTLAEDATSAANQAASNANAKATLADEKATLANQKATLADSAAQNANAKAELANASAAKIDNMTVDQQTLAAGSPANVTVTEVDGHKHIHFGLPRGDKGDPGPQGPAGPQGPKGDSGVSDDVLQAAIAAYLENHPEIVESHRKVVGGIYADENGDFYTYDREEDIPS